MVNNLVVEDDIKLNKIVCTYLNNSGYAAKGCLNPREAYDLMYNNPVDLIISDIMMPEIDGYEFAAAVREINKTIPILFITSRDDIGSKQKGFMAGIDDYMVNTNTHVTVVIPGGIATDIKKNSNASSKSATKEEKNSKILLSSAKAASLILKGMETNKYKMIIGMEANLMHLLYSVSPKAAISLMNKVMASNSH